ASTRTTQLHLRNRGAGSRGDEDTGAAAPPRLKGGEAGGSRGLRSAAVAGFPVAGISVAVAGGLRLCGALLGRELQVLALEPRRRVDEHVLAPLGIDQAAVDEHLPE